MLIHSDDGYLTEEAYLEQPDGQTPIISGFYYLSKLFRCNFVIAWTRSK